MAEAPAPSAEDLAPVFKHLYEACMAHNLPIGLAPNIHVSLVLLPEECRLFNGNRFRFKELKRRLFAKTFAAHYYWRRR
jgi:hypothetical protein